MNNFSSACSRREFLQRSAAFAGGALAMGRLPAAFAATGLTQIGAQLYTVRDALKADFSGTLKKISAMGYRGVQISKAYGQTAEEIRKA